MSSAFAVAKMDDEKRLIFGWASVSADLSGKMIEDLQGDMLDIDELERAAYDFVLEFRNAGERHDPALRKRGRLVESCVFTPEKLAAMGITCPVKKAWWVGFYIDDDLAWEKVKSGEYEMFSIEGKAIREGVAKSFRDALSAVDVAAGVRTGSAASFAELMASEIERVERKSVAKSFIEWLQKFNPYHDPKGKFTTGDTATMFSLDSKFLANNQKAQDLFSYFNTRRGLMQHAAQSLGIPAGSGQTFVEVNGKFRMNLLNVNNSGKSDPFLEQHLEEANPKPVPKIVPSIPQTPGKAVDWKSVSDDDFVKTLDKEMPGHKQIVDALDKAGYDLSKSWGSSGLIDTKQNGDMALTEIYKHRGFNALPTMMDKAAIKQYIAAKKMPELYRGMGTSSNGQSGAEKQTRFAQDPLHFAGLGVLGNGTYAAQTPVGKSTNTGINVARAYSHHAPDGVVRMTLDKTAKKATFATVRGEQTDFQNRVMRAFQNGVISMKEHNALRCLTDDPGRFAALRGYDAFYDRSSKHSGANASHPFWVILNRGKTIIQNERYT
jgi:hypothetical protein